MIQEAPVSTELAPHPYVIRYIDRVRTSQDLQVIHQYAALLLNPHNVTHFGWPLFNNPDLSGVTLDTLYDTDGPKDEYVVSTAQKIAAILHQSDDFLSVLELDKSSENLIAAGMVGAPPPAENEAWLYKAVALPESQSVGYGSTLIAARIREVFRRFPNLRNIYTGVTYNRTMSDEEKVALQQTAEHFDIFYALRNGITVDHKNLKLRFGALRSIFEIQGHPSLAQIEVLNDLAERYERSLPIVGLSPTSMKLRRKILADAFSALGYSFTPTEYIYLKLGAYHTQFLSEQGQTIMGPNFPTGRLVLKRDVWDIISAQME